MAEDYVASCFISYNHADAELAQGIAEELRSRDYFVWIDEGRLKVGDSLIRSIGDAIDQVDFLIALVSENSVQSNWCQKEIALAMTGEINRRGINVLPCRVGSVAMPSSLLDKLYLPVQNGDVKAAATELDRHMRLHLAPEEGIPARRAKPSSSKTGATASTQWWDVSGPASKAYDPHVPARMTGVDLNGVTQPRNDGSRGSALYRIPITLDVRPDAAWAQLFVHHWDHPTSWSTMHRPGIASVSGDRLILDGTTMNELEQYHLATLRLAVDAANHDRKVLVEQEEAQRRQEADARRTQQEKDAEIARRLNFE